MFVVALCARVSALRGATVRRGVQMFGIVALSLAGSILGVRLSAVEWLTLLGLLLVGLVPFAVLGILFGHLIPIDSLGPALGGVTSLLALLGGAFGPLVTTGVLFTVIKYLPSYWLVQAGKSALGGGNVWPAQAWIVLAVWSIVLARVAARVYRRDTSKV